MSKIITTILFLLLTLVLFADVELIKEGKPVSEIVISKDAIQCVKLAAEDLRKHLELISGAKLPIVNAPSPGVRNQIYVGGSKFTRKLGFVPAKFKNSAYEILVKDNYVILNGPDKQRKLSPFKQSNSDNIYLKSSIITGKVYPKPKKFPSSGLKAWQDFCGEKFSASHLNASLGEFNRPLGIYVNDDPGTWYAVAAFLENLGVRWYMPYENGTVIPEKKTVSIPEQHIKKEAGFARREWCYYGAMRQDAEGIAWLKRLKCGNYVQTLLNHLTYNVFYSYQQQLLHPEYLACGPDGKPYEGYPVGRGICRFGNPGFKNASVLFMNKVIEAFPELSGIMMGQPDGGVKIDTRDIKLYGKEGDDYTQLCSNCLWDYNVHLAKELKKSHPDKFLYYMYYGAAGRRMPTNMKDDIPDNIIVLFVHYGHTAYRVLKYNDENIRKNRKKWLSAINQKGKSPVWEHYLYYSNPSKPRYPVIFTRKLQDVMKEDLKISDGKFIEVQAERYKDKNGKQRFRLGFPGLMHLMIYCQSKLYWDPDLDREKMLDEYYNLFYGPAAAEMKEFYEFAEEVWRRQESRNITETTGFLKEKDVDKYFELLKRAREKAGKNTVYDKRIAMLENEMRPLKKLFPNLKRKGPDFRLYTAPENFKIDGKLSEYKNGWTVMREMATAEKPAKNLTKVVFAITPDKSVLIIGVECFESNMNKLKAYCKRHDDFSIFEDDVVEIYLNTPEHSYFKIVVNSNGAVWDETTDMATIEKETLPILWNPGVKAAIKKYPDRWKAEIMIPTKDFGKLGPTKNYPWGVQVGRTRFTGGSPEIWTVAPMERGPYKNTSNWGNLWMK